MIIACIAIAMMMVVKSGNKTSGPEMKVHVL